MHSLALPALSVICLNTLLCAVSQSASTPALVRRVAPVTAREERVAALSPHIDSAVAAIPAASAPLLPRQSAGRGARRARPAERGAPGEHMVKPASAHGKVQHTARVLQSAVLWTCTCAAWHLCSRPREAPAAAHCPPLPRGRSPLTAPCLLLGHSRVCVALVAVAGRRCACTVCTTQRACRVDCSRPPSPPRTSRRPCTGLRARDGHGRREQAASCSEQLPWDRAPVCLPGAGAHRTRGERGRSPRQPAQTAPVGPPSSRRPQPLRSLQPYTYRLWPYAHRL